MKIRKDAIEDTVPLRRETSVLKHQSKQLELGVVVEALLGVLVAVVGGYFVLTTLGSIQLVFCLFCLLIFAIAIRSSRKISYGAGFLAAAGYAFLAWHFARMDLHILLLATFLMQPFLLIVVSILASDLLHNQRIRLYRAEMQIGQDKEQLLQLSQQFEKVLESKKDLQQQVIEQEAPIASVCHQITLLWQLTDEERYSAIVDLIVQATGAKSSALYLEQGKQFFLQTSRSTQNISYPARLNEDDLLVKKVLQHGQVCTIREILRTEQEPSADIPMMAGPLSKGKHLLGVVIVGTMPLTKFTSSTTQLFTALLRLVSISLQDPAPPPETNTIDLQDVLNDEKTQQLTKVLNNEKMQPAEYEPDDEKTQVVTSLKYKYKYARK